ncbi:tetratricopeptide repeat protein [Moraxella sp. VT-16-12]|uniref:tetratricopeptide repeat protein n=1 Tax=Moraxella sp. VT-16-12 TaxID=2014877 RepID=UPI000B7DB8F9|nr:tetratricopeptide repeat protein [Moraxella sp. VT-16-12]TWV80234.1 sel1 repeat family protein [Moraxella sp. VT-16-12]
MKKIILPLLAVVFTHGAMADDVTGKPTQTIIKTTNGDFNAYGRAVAYLEANLHALDFVTIKQAANTGDDKAQFLMAKFYELGIHTPKDQVQALKWYEKSAKLSNGDAQNNLAVYYLKNNDPKKAREYLSYAVNQNHLMAMVNLGRDLLKSGDESNRQTAIELLKKASAGGYAPADYVLAFDVYDDTDEVLAMQHLQKAANAGFAPAQWELAGNYQMAVLSLASPEQRMQYAKKAVMWASRACDNAHEFACNLKDYYEWNPKKEALYQEYTARCQQGEQTACQEAKFMMAWKHEWESMP